MQSFIYFLNLCWLSTNFGPFSRRQPHYRNVNRCILMISTQKSPRVWKESWVTNPVQATICTLTFEIICQGQSQHKNWTWNDLWNLLIITINLKDKHFHNYLDLSRLFLQFCPLPAMESVLLKKRLSHTLQGKTLSLPN